LVEFKVVLPIRLISANLAPITLASSILAYLYPRPFMIFEHSFLWLFAATMFALGVVLEVAELRETVRRPRWILSGLFTQYSVMPLLGFGAAMFWTFSPELGLGFIIVACAPGAMASNVIVYLAGGAVAYSVALTTLATFASPVMTPFLVEVLGGALLEIPFWPMMRTILLMVLLPLVAGMGVRRFLGARMALAQRIAPALAALAIVIICSYAVAVNHVLIATVGYEVITAVVVVNGLGYAAGWWLGRFYGFDAEHRLALAVEIGMQNAGLGVALALKHFSPQTALPGALFAVWCIISAAGATRFLRSRQSESSTA
jgi:BASS family bile acid:Na+ symporter